MKKILRVLAMVYCSSILSQEIDKNIDPTSPEAFAFEKYGNTPVNMYTGTPDISIPIYNVTVGNLSLPISLIYDASGIRVNQVSSTVGLGWNLNFGGMVVRKTNGLPDQSIGGGYRKIYEQQQQTLIGSFNNNSTLPMTGDNSGQLNSFVQMVQDYEISNIDLEADTFTFNFPGLSGTIGVNYNNNTAFCIEHPDIKASFDTNSLNGEIEKWTIINNQGVKYEFFKTEKTLGTYSSMQNEYQYEYVSGWYLTKISLDNNEIILNYSANQAWLNSQPIALNSIRETMFQPNCQMVGEEIQETITTVIPDNGNGNPAYKLSQPYFSSITANGKMVLTTQYSSQDRIDLAGRKSLSNIKILDFSSSQVKKIEFVQTYFTSNQTIQQGQEELFYRLKLDEVKVFNKNNTDSHSYYFSYLDEDKLPPRNSSSQDYWGYYNGSSHTNMIAGNTQIREDLRILKVNNHVFQGNNREPNFGYARTGTLNKVTYPTGGSTEYFYQSPRGNEYVKNENVTPQNIIRFKGGYDSSLSGQEVISYYTDNQGLCDDGYNQVPYTADYRITIGPDDVNKLIEFETEAISIPNSNQPPPGYLPYQEYYIYKSDSPKTYCEFKRNSVSNIISSGAPGNTTFNLIFSQQGNYYLSLLSNKDIEYKWKITKPVRQVARTKTDYLGGLVVYKITSNSNDQNSNALTKYYYYNDFSVELNDPNSLVSSDISISSAPIFADIFNETYQTPVFQIRPNKFGNGFETYVDDASDEIIIEQNSSGIMVAKESNLGINSGDVPILNDQGLVLWIPFATIQQNVNTIIQDIVDNLNQQQTSTSEDPLESVFTSGYLTSAIVHQKLIFNKILVGTGYDSNCSGSNWGSFTDPLGPDRYLYKKLQMSSNNMAPKTKHNFGFSKVSEISFDSKGNFIGYSVYDFYNEDEGLFDINRPIYTSTLNGRVIGENYYNNNQTLLKQKSNLYSKNNISNNNPSNGLYFDLKETHSGVCPIYSHTSQSSSFGYVSTLDGSSCNIGFPKTLNQYSVNDYTIGTFWLRLDKTIERDFYNGVEKKSETQYYYTNNIHKQVTSAQTLSSNGDLFKTNTFYPHDLGNSTLINQNKIAVPLKTESYKGVTKISTKNNIFSFFNGNYLLEKVQSSKGSQPLEDRVIYHKYDNKGNPLEVSKKDGNKTYYVWGYNQTQPIAKIEGYTDAELSNVMSLINSAISASNSDNSRCLQSSNCNETSLRNSLNLIRNNSNMSNAQVTTFTYDPLIGVTSITDPRGQTIYYHYDNFNRLQYVKDNEGNILSENQYNYKN